MIFPDRNGDIRAMATFPAPFFGAKMSRSLDWQCLGGSFFGAFQLSVFVPWINLDLGRPAGSVVVPGRERRIGH